MRSIIGLACAAALAACAPSAPVEQASAPMTAETPEAAAVAVNAALAGCDRPEDAPAEAPVVSALEGGARLIAVPCAVAAYQTSTRFFVSREGEPPQLQTFVGYEAGAFFGTPDAFNAEFDAASGVLTTLAKAAGHGGCGYQATYRWDGVAFTLQEMRAQSCGEGPPPEDGFPVVWAKSA